MSGDGWWAAFLSENENVPRVYMFGDMLWTSMFLPAVVGYSRSIMGREIVRTCLGLRFRCSEVCVEGGGVLDCAVVARGGWLIILAGCPRVVGGRLDRLRTEWAWSWRR